MSSERQNGNRENSGRTDGVSARSVSLTSVPGASVTRLTRREKTSPYGSEKAGVSPEQRWHMVAQAAYFRAEKRGFIGGDPGEDWLVAEAEVDARIADRKAAVKWSELQEREARLRTVMDTVTDGIITTDERGVIDGFNRAAEQMFGYTAREVVGRNVRLLMPSPQREQHDTYIADYLRTGQAKVINTGRECSARRKDGTTFSVDLGISEFRIGTHRYFAGVVRDITGRKAAEQAIRESEEQFRNLIEGSIEGICIHRNWKPLFANQALADILGYESPEEILALESFQSCVAPHERARLEKNLAARLRGEDVPIKYEYDAMRKDGSIVTLDKVVRLVQWEGQTAVQNTVIDITHRRLAEERLRQREAELAHVARLSTVSELATTLAHELNQPLTAIVSYAEGAARRLRSRKKTGKPLLDALDQIVALSKRAAGIVRGMRAFVRKQPVNGEKVDLNEVVSEAVRLVIAQAQQKGITVITELLPTLPAIRGNFVQLEQVVLNLMLNGIEAMDASEDRNRTLTLRTFTNDRNEVELTVSDTGTGLPEEEIATRIFDGFVTTKADGLGMGLSIGRSIVEAHHGRIWVDPGPGKGASFHVAVPILSADDGTAD